MSGYALLLLERNRGWPWPERSWGLDSMYGDDGWCRSCGIPLRDQGGPVTLQRRGLERVEGAWMPNWLFDCLCLEAGLAARLAAEFDLTSRDIAWRGVAPGAARQVVIPVVGERWFDPERLRAATVAEHGATGTACDGCQVWRWMPLAGEKLPRLEIAPEGFDGRPIVASPEWFGAGWQAFRQIAVREDLAQEIASASPRDFVVDPLPG